MVTYVPGVLSRRGTRLVASTGDLMSPTPPNTFALSAAQARAIKKVRVMVGGGCDDSIHPSAEIDLWGLRRAGIRPFADFINGGHNGNVWRILLRDFLTHVAFTPNGA
jgi:hypothetical protein